MMRKILSLAFLALISYQSFAQNFTGIVLDKKTKEALQNVSIYLEKNTLGTTTNSYGRFQFTIPDNTKRRQKITFSCIGYSTLQTPIKEINDSIFLSKEIQKIGEVQVANKRILKPSLSYQKVTKLNCGLYAFGAFLKDDKIYIIGGNESLNTDHATAFRNAVEKTGGEVTLDDIAKQMSKIFTWENYSNLLQVYDLKSKTWKEEKDHFEKRANHNVELFDNKAYVIGGTRIKGKREYLQDIVEIYYPDLDSVVVDEVIPHQAVNFASGAAGDYLIMAGGSVNKDKKGTITYTDKTHLFDIKTGLWYEMAPMLKAKECKGIYAGSNFYLIGGNDGTAQNQIEVFDFKEDRWQTEVELPTGISSPALCYSEETIFIFENKYFWSYNIKTKVLRRYHINLNLTEVEMFYSDNKIYIVGGDDVEEYSNQPSQFIYSIDMKELSKTQHKVIPNS